jgi:hypothetical protein
LDFGFSILDCALPRETEIETENQFGAAAPQSKIQNPESKIRHVLSQPTNQPTKTTKG